MPGQRAALAVLILIEAAAFGYMSETIVFPTFVAIVTFLGWRGPWRYSLSPDRQVILALVTAVLFVVKWRVQPHSLFDDAMNYLSPFLHSLGQYLLVLQSAALFLRFERDVLPITLPWPGVFVMISAGDVTVGSNSTTRLMFQLFALAFTGTAALFFAATARQASAARPLGESAGKRGVVAVLLGVTVVIAGLASLALHRYESALNRLVSELLAPSMTTSSAGFPSRAQIGSVARRKSERSQDLAMRVYAKGEPGYLRGKAYHWLSTFGASTQWEEAPPHRSDSDPLGIQDEQLAPAGRDGGRYRFDLRIPPGGDYQPARSLEIWLEPSLWGVYFLPPHAAEIVTDERSLRRDFRQVTSGVDDGTAAYRVQTGPVEESIFPRLTAAGGVLTKQSLTYVPETPYTAGDDRDVEDLARRIFRDCRTVDEHCRAVEEYFHANYGYAIGIDPPPGQDPLRWFLLTKPNAHCEYFAQAAAFLLRMEDIPTRYMTGFVVAERNEYGDFWIARNAHAHAWCEAWDEDRGWVIVEATPAAGVPDETVAPWHRQMWEHVSGELTRFRYQFAEGGWTWLLQRLLAFFATPVGGLLAAVVVVYGLVRWRMISGAAAGPRTPPRIRELHRLLARIDQRVAKAGLVRDPGETVARFGRRVATETGDLEAADWYAAYAAARYRNPTDATVDELRDRLQSIGRAPGRSTKPTPQAARTAIEPPA